MIARVRLLLPFSVFVPASAQLPPQEFDVGELHAKIYAPYRSVLDPSILTVDSPVPMFEIPRRLHPADPQPTTDAVTLDGDRTVIADVLQVDFTGRDFDRTSGSDDPATERVFAVANQFLTRLRVLARAGHIRTLDPHRTSWQLEYLHDDGTLFESDPDLRVYTKRQGATFSVSVISLSPGLWTAAGAIAATYQPRPWETLHLDALAVLPDVGPSMALAAAAIETRVANALDVLATRTGFDPALWKWLTERGGDYTKEPSVSDQLDILMRSLSGRSLKDVPRLWEASQNVRKARNSLVHEGIAKIGDEVVTTDRAAELVAQAGDVLDWIEEGLPVDERRPRHDTPSELQITRLLAAPTEPKPG